MKISGLKQRKIALPRPKVSLRLKRPTLSRGKIVLLCVCAALLIVCCVLGFVYSDTAGRLLAQQARSAIRARESRDTPRPAHSSPWALKRA